MLCEWRTQACFASRHIGTVSQPTHIGRTDTRHARPASYAITWQHGHGACINTNAQTQTPQGDLKSVFEAIKSTTEPG